MKNMRVIRLKVAESIHEDIGKNLARMDSRFMNELDVKLGDFVLIKKENEIIATVAPCYPGDKGINIVRLDLQQRKNVGISVVSYVDIYKIDVVEAKNVVIQLTIIGSIRLHSVLFLNKVLIGKPVIKGNSLVINEEVEMPNEKIKFGIFDTRLKIIDVEPNKPAIITKNTKIILHPGESIEIEEEINSNLNNSKSFKEKLKEVPPIILLGIICIIASLLSDYKFFFAAGLILIIWQLLIRSLSKTNELRI